MEFVSPELLIVGTSTDPHVGAVSSRLAGSRICRLDVDRYPTEVSISLIFDKAGPTVIFDDGEVVWDITHPRVAWFRRLGQPRLNEELQPEYRLFARDEARQTIEGALGLVAPISCFNAYGAVRNALSKPFQYARAASCGLIMPDTLFTSSPSRFSKWHEGRDEVIAKSISRPLIAEGGEFGRQFSYTHLLDSSDLEDIERLKLAPCQFQTFVDGVAEFRVTSIAGQHYAASIEGLETPDDGRRDWRPVAMNAEYRIVELPKSVTVPLETLMDDLNLDFAASDFIFDGNEYYFLEANPNGAWMWLESHLPTSVITDAVAGHLEMLLIQ